MKRDAAADARRAPVSSLRTRTVRNQRERPATLGVEPESHPHVYEWQITRCTQLEGIDMRYLVIAAVMAVGVGLFGMGDASAAPANGQAISQSAEQASSVTKVWGGCGRGWHRNRWGRCVP
jgi:hypothetical protein